MHYIYKITNLINSKIYIGQTNDPRGRWNEHKSFAKNSPTMLVDRKIKQYGVNNFDFEVIVIIIPVDNEIEYCKITNDIEEEMIIQEFSIFH